MRDVNRLRILQDVIDRNLRPGLAAEMLGITPRHCSRLLKRYRQSGPLGMNNQSRGRTGNRLLPVTGSPCRRWPLAPTQETHREEIPAISGRRRYAQCAEDITITF